MSKPVLVDQIREQLKEQLNVMQAAAAEARENATGDETRSDGKYDTRAIEAGYLAGAQARQADHCLYAYYYSLMGHGIQARPAMAAASQAAKQPGSKAASQVAS